MVLSPDPRLRLSRGPASITLHLGGQEPSLEGEWVGLVEALGQGPCTPSMLAETMGLDMAEVEAALETLAAHGALARAAPSSGDVGDDAPGGPGA